MRPEIFYWTWFVLLAVLALVALMRGGWTERFMIWAYLAASLASVMVINHAGWGRPQLGLMAVDAVTAVAFLVLMLRSDQVWVMIASGLQWLTVAIHVVRMIFPFPSATADVGGGYASLLLLLSWAVLAILAYGVIRAALVPRGASGGEAGSSEQP